MKIQHLRSVVLKTILSATFMLMAMTMQAQWTVVDTPGFVPGGDLYQHLFIDSTNTPYVSFSGLHGEVMEYKDSNWVYVGGADITPGTAYECWSTIAPNGNIYFSYADGTDSSKAAVKVYNGRSWSILASDLSSGAAASTNIVASSTGTLYLSYIDEHSTPYILYVKEYASGAWTTVGGQPVDTNGAGFPSLAIDNNDSLYIAYVDASLNGVVVKKYNGTSWIQLDTDFSAIAGANIAYTSLAIDNAGTPYTSYITNDSLGSSVCVSKFNGLHWLTVGRPAFSPVSTGFPALSIDHSNVPYVAFDDNTLGGAASAMKYNDTGWSYLGSADFSSPSAVFMTIAIDGNNNPYVAFIDGSNGGTTVMKYPACTPASEATIAATDTSICKGQSTTLTAAGMLNNATDWYWYTGSCSGTLADSGSSITVAPSDTTTYYVKGFGGCVLSAMCNAFTVDVDSLIQPTVSVSGDNLTSSVASGNQWYKNDEPITGATATTYSVTVSGWYKVATTNSNGCTSTSDSVFVNVADGVVNIKHTIDASVYPSPAIDVVNVDFTGPQADWANTSINISDNLGRNMWSSVGKSQKNIISVSGWPAGIYFITLVNQHEQKVMKITKL